jgi:hypothetical protein
VRWACIIDISFRRMPFDKHGPLDIADESRHILSKNILSSRTLIWNCLCPIKNERIRGSIIKLKTKLERKASSIIHSKSGSMQKHVKKSQILIFY